MDGKWGLVCFLTKYLHHNEVGRGAKLVRHCSLKGRPLTRRILGSCRTWLCRNVTLGMKGESLHAIFFSLFCRFMTLSSIRFSPQKPLHPWNSPLEHHDLFPVSWHASAFPLDERKFRNPKLFRKLPTRTPFIFPEFPDILG